MSDQQTQTTPTRRKFLTGAAAAATGAALGFPAIVKAQGPTSFRWQSTWPSKDIFHEYALDYAKKVNDMTGGEIVPAIDRGLLDGAEFNNQTSDRLLGFPDVSKVCMLQSFHQNAEQFEITFNKTKYDALPDKLKSIIAHAVDAASADLVWKSIDRYSKDYIEMQTKDKVRFYRTPDAILRAQIDAYDKAVDKRKDNPLFVEIAESQKRFAERVVKWDLDTNVRREMAYNHYFGKGAKPAAKKA